MKELEIIQQFEKDFIEAGKMAVRLRSQAIISNKYSSGIKDIDIVTTSDLAVQETVLEKLAKSELKNCLLVGEEKTPGKRLFADHSDLVLTIDPIDGTMAYATGGKYYSIIITIHDRKRPIYTFDYFPEINWGIKIVNDKIEFIGQRPDLSNITIPSKTIAYPAFKGKAHPKIALGKLYEKLVKDGYSFKTKDDLGHGLGATLSFVLGLTDGFFYEDGSAVDCLVGMHYGLAKGYTIFNTMDITEPKPSDFSGGTEEYKGYYLILKQEKPTYNTKDQK